MNIEELLDALVGAKASLKLKNGTLAVTSPKGQVSDALKESLREHKEALIELLASGRPFRVYTGGSGNTFIPANRIRPDGVAITPDMLPLITLSQADIDRIVGLVPGGVAN
ncbi:hypothetical protein ACFONN_21400, partial [Dyella humi]